MGTTIYTLVTVTRERKVTIYQDEDQGIIRGILVKAVAKELGKEVEFFQEESRDMSLDEIAESGNMVDHLFTLAEKEVEDEERLFIISSSYDSDEYPTFCKMYSESDPGYTRGPLEIYWDRISDMMQELSKDEAKVLEEEYDRVAKQGNYIQVVE